MRKLTTDEFIEKAQQIHGDKYNYSLVEYVNSKTKVKIICQIHGVFEQIPSNHLKGCNCKKCEDENNSIRLSKGSEKFIEEAKQIHGDKYDYSLVEYKNNKTDIKIFCKKCQKYFLQTPKHHLNGSGCPFEANNILKTTDQFIEEAKQIHGDKYDYSLVEYKGARIDVEIKCNKCYKIFKQAPLNHLVGQRCPFCFGTPKKTTDQFIEEAKQIHGDKYDYSLVEYNGRTKNIKLICKKCEYIFNIVPFDHLDGYGCPVCSSSKRIDTEVFILKAKQIHGDKYDYSKTIYTNSHKDVEIVCREHGSFYQKAYIHLNGYGCSSCNSFKGELRIESFLKEKSIYAERYKKFDDLIDKSQLNYDFYIPSKNLLIEYNGEQHYEYNSFFHKKTHCFHKQKHHDWLKRKYARDNGINLLVIPYWEYDNIEKILKEELINENN